MKKKILVSLILCAAVLCTLFAGTVANAETPRYQVGYAIRDINPWVDPNDHSKGVLPVELTGNGNNHLRACTGFMDDNDDGVVGEGDGLFTTATAVTDPYGKTMIYITIDSLQGYAGLTKAVRTNIVKELGANKISGDQIMVNGNHTHSGPYFDGLKSSKKPGEAEYYEYTVAQITAAAVDAYNDRAEAVMTKGAIDAKESTAHMGYNSGKGYHMNAIRHYDVSRANKNFASDKMGHVTGSNFGGANTIPSKYQQVSRVPALESDNTMYLLMFDFPDNEEKQPILLVNWRAHSTGNSSGDTMTKVSSDYAGSLRANLAKAGYRSAFIQGAGGNVVTNSTGVTEGDMMTDWLAECPNGRDLNIYGRLLSAIAQDCVKRSMTKELPAGRIRNLQTTFHGDKQEDSEGMLAAAIAYTEGSAALGENKYLTTPYAYTHTDGKQYFISSKFHASSIISRSKAGDTFTDCEVNVIVMGDNVAFVTAPNEIADRYDINGSKKNEDNDWYDLIEEDTYGMPFVMGYTNGGNGYMPFSLEYDYNSEKYYQLTGLGKNAWKYLSPGSYESNTSRYAQGTGEALVQYFKTMLETVDEVCYVKECAACGTEVEWKPIMDVRQGALNVTSGHYYLNQDVPMGVTGTNRVSLDSGDKLCLDLNGHKMETPSRSFYINSGATLNLFDSVGTGYVISYTGGNNVGGGTVFVASSGVFNMYGGTLQFIRQEVPEDKYETGNGAVISSSGTIRMYGGKLIGGELTKSEYYGIDNSTNGCGGTVYLSGKMYVYGGEIVSGKAAPGARGDCVYVVNSATRLYLYNDAKIDEIYINDVGTNQLVVYNEFTGKAAVYYNPTNISLDDESRVGTANSKTSFTEENLYCTSHPQFLIVGTGSRLEATARKEGAAVVAHPEGNAVYDSLAEALANEKDSCIVLLKDITEPVEISEDACLDLNGFSITGKITVADGKTLYCRDSATDDYTVADGKYGKLTDVFGNVKGLYTDSGVIKDGYLMVYADNAYSFHRVNLRLSAMVLRPVEAGMYYKSGFAGDEIVAKNVKQYGIAMSIEGVPEGERFMDSCAYSWNYNFASGAAGNSASGTLLTGVMKQTNTAEANLRNAETEVYGRAYILLNDGTVIFGDPVNRSLRQQVEDVSKQWTSFNAEQQNAAIAMYNTYSDIMADWNITKLVAAAAAAEPEEEVPETTENQ